MRLGILVNPVHPRSHRAHHRLVTLLDGVGIGYRTMSTSPARTGAWQAAQLIRWGAEAIVLLGGDGTLRAAAPVLAAAGVPVLVVPTGTSNVFSRGVGVHAVHQGLALCEDFIHGAADRIAVPVAVASCEDGDVRREEHFLSLAGIGGDARAVAGHRREWGLLGYAAGAIAAAFAPEFDARIDGEDMRVWSVMAAKTPRPAGPVPVFPGAEVESEELSFLAVVLGTSALAGRLGGWARIASACLRGRPESDPALRYWTARRARIDVTQPVRVQLDGDSLGEVTGLEFDTGELLLDVIVRPARG